MRHDQIKIPLFHLIAVLILAPFAADLAGAEGIQFAGDHYKVEGGPKIDVSVVNPVFAPGADGTLRLILANDGVMDRLVPGVVPSGSEVEAAQEMLAEFGCLDASNLKADLHSDGPIAVLSGPIHIDLLRSGRTAPLEFDIDIKDGVEGPIPLRLDLEYERQVDVSFSGGTASPLYLPSNLQLDLILSVEGDPPALELMGTRADLSPGEKGSISIIVGNAGESDAENCTARLVAPLPFKPLADRHRLGDIPPGGVAVARFDVLVEESAQVQEYRIGCEISHGEEITSLSVPLTVVSTDGARLLRIPLVGLLLGALALAIFWLLRDRGNGSLRRRGPLRPRR